MDSFAEQLPLIIEKSAQSPLSLLALIIVALSGMAILLFRNASEQAKMRIFMSLSAGILLLAFQILYSANTIESTGDAPVDVAVDAEPAPEDTTATPAAPPPAAPPPAAPPRSEQAQPAADQVNRNAVSNTANVADNSFDTSLSKGAVRDEPAPATINFEGLWYDADSIEYEFYQFGTDMSFDAWSPLLEIFIGEGEGQIVGNRIDYTVATIDGATGNGSVTLSPDGRTLQGAVTDHSTGIRSEVFLRKGP